LGLRLAPGLGLLPAPPVFLSVLGLAPSLLVGLAPSWVGLGAALGLGPAVGLAPGLAPLVSRFYC
jgi:hypothetical protein